MLGFALFAAGCVFIYLSSRFLLKHACSELRRQFQEQFDSLNAEIRLLQRSVAARPTLPQPQVESNKPSATPTLERTVASQADEEVTPETRAIITDTIAGLLGKNVCVLSAKKIALPAHQTNVAHSSFESSEAWARQGRVLVHTSHESLYSRRTLATTAQPAVSPPGGDVDLEATDHDRPVRIRSGDRR